MSTTTQGSPTTEQLAPDADKFVRDEFLHAVSHVGLGPERAAALVEVCCGRPFRACGRAELLPLLNKLLTLVRRANIAVNAESACDV